MSDYQNLPRRTFAIISHPDAGKTTLTEKLLFLGGAIDLAGSVKSRKSARHATSDWMALEQQRGISVTTSVMQFVYQGYMVNLLDTPGHADFTEDTYRTLTAVDSALMVIDAAKGVEDRTIKLMQVCRLRDTPIMTFINKCDRDGQEPIALLDEIEEVLSMPCTPITWPLGLGRDFAGVYHLLEDKIYCYDREGVHRDRVIDGLDNPELDQLLGDRVEAVREEIDLVRGACVSFSKQDYLEGRLTPVYFGSAMNDFGVSSLLDGFVKEAPGPLARATTDKEVSPEEGKFSGFVFKIQANMDPMHRDRIAFLRIVSGQYKKGMKSFQVRTKKQVNLSNAMTFLAGAREHTDHAAAGDIIGLPNHGTIQIGDTFTQGASFSFTGIPNFAPEMFRLVRLKDPLKQKALLKGLIQLSEEGATQVFRPLLGNHLILGAVGVLQFDVVAHRLASEYKVDCVYESVNTVTARWIECEDEARLKQFKNEQQRYLALDGADSLTYLAPSRVNLELLIEAWPEILFRETREHVFS